MIYNTSRHPIFAFSKLIALGALATLGFAATSSLSAQLIENGSFESWTDGMPDDWTLASAPEPTQISGLVAGSDSAVLMTTGGRISQNIVEAPEQAVLSLTFASSAAATSSARAFSIAIGVNGGIPSINLRLFNTTGDSGSQLLSLRAYDGISKQYVTIAENAFTASVYDTEAGSFTTLNAYNMSINVDYMSETPSYSIAYGAVGGEMTTISNISYFQDATISTVNAVYLTDAGAGCYYAVDNMSLASVPEPESSTFILLGLTLAFMLFLRRRK
ncbi:PEP-CTERM sorting domain-containing protein [Ruficoccus sp. ZRK36]|uniref:PEP-CTERM sorting domain-containing protein n=1 Tax=Ruficoccus sp. ZRK36 TaxID=2866311 RepID=UPI001C738348|nr:PEP-CTERM sorting domain-containing protein [Ruficoccus sp. ZRK36]QYY37458.1 PEP-CTERM sorting domain-containing protein [Ruficoccus sp. ZRK36]